MKDKTASVELTKKKDCKHSVAFETDENGAALSGAYINRSMPGIAEAQKIRVTVEIIG